MSGLWCWGLSKTACGLTNPSGLQECFCLTLWWPCYHALPIWWMDLWEWRAHEATGQVWSDLQDAAFHRSNSFKFVCFVETPWKRLNTLETHCNTLKCGCFVVEQKKASRHWASAGRWSCLEQWIWSWWNLMRSSILYDFYIFYIPLTLPKRFLFTWFFAFKGWFVWPFWTFRGLLGIIYWFLSRHLKQILV